MIAEFPARQCTVLYNLGRSSSHGKNSNNTDHLKQVLNSCCKMISQELINSVINGCCRADSLSIVSVNSVTSASLFVVNFIPVETFP